MKAPVLGEEKRARPGRNMVKAIITEKNASLLVAMFPI
jgi:hypothetical protein